MTQKITNATLVFEFEADREEHVTFSKMLIESYKGHVKATYKYIPIGKSFGLKITYEREVPDE